MKSKRKILKLKAMLNNLCLFVILLFLFASTESVFALYPDKEDYIYKEKAADVYVFAGVGTATTSSLGRGAQLGYKPLFSPVNLLDGGFAHMGVGFRLAANKGSFLSDVRYEIENIYSYQLYDRIQDGNLSSVADGLLPLKSREVLKNAVAFSVIYDMRFLSPLFYPYVGFGIGYGQFKYLSVDLEMQKYNGMGEQYDSTSNGLFGQFRIGVSYDTKIIKSSFYLEYRLITAFASQTMIPGNDGTMYSTDPGIVACYEDIDGENEGNREEDDYTCKIPDDLVRPSPKDVKYMNHVIAFGFKYYLY
jgi:hypothetical protein